MNFGNISGLVNGTEQVVFDSEVTGSAVSSISTGNILNGDEDGWYTIIVRSIVANNNSFRLNFNSDTNVANYGWRGIVATDTTVANTSSATAGIYSGGGGVSGLVSFSIHKVYAKSGSVRLINSTIAEGVSGTTVVNLFTLGQVWNNTSDNIISAQLVSVGTDNLGVGTRIIILKSNNFTNGTPTGVINTPYIQGSWVRVGTYNPAADWASKTFTDLDGDRDVLYRVVLNAKNSYNGPSSGYIYLNSDDAAHYGYQNLYGQNTLVGASRAAHTALSSYISFAAINEIAHGEWLIFAKSGFVRPALGSVTRNISGTSVGIVGAEGTVWNNTADTIFSIGIGASRAFSQGSSVELYALRPNG